jgi:ribosomal protein L11 methyltransferase
MAARPDSPRFNAGRFKWLEITVTTAPQAVEAVANILLESRTGGVEEAHPAPGVVQLRGYLPVGPAVDVILASIEQRVRNLPGFGLEIGPGRINTSIVEDAGWAYAWKNHFKAFPVGRRFWITPTWSDTPPPSGRLVVELDPGMAFGSGLHASTQLCLMLLEDRVRGGERVVDIGTGSGILAIAAAKLGAAAILAIDIDPVAVGVAQRNVAHNGVARHIEVRQGDLLRDVAGQTDVILANLTADILLDLLPTVRSFLTSEGVVVASGIIADRQLEVEAVATAAGLHVAEVRRDGEWRCLVLTVAAPPLPASRGSTHTYAAIVGDGKA